MTENPSLKRSLSLTLMVLYGLGTTIGAGIYVLAGKLADIAGYFSLLSFIVASFMAGLTALSFAEIAGRFPRASGSAFYVSEGFGSLALSTMVGLLVITAAIVSSAALINGFVDHLYEFWQFDRTLSIIVVVLILGLIAFWGISESVTIAAIITLVEVGGLILVIVVSRSSFTHIGELWQNYVPSWHWHDWNIIFAGSILAFYAFIGFEDMVVVAEEVKNVKRTLPLAILLTLVITTLLYVLVMLAATMTLTPETLARSQVPLATVYEQNQAGGKLLFGFIGMFAIINGALIQLILASRMLYGLSIQQQLPAWLSRVHSYTRTPVWATALATFLLIALALSGTVTALAKTTSLIMLLVFSLVNLALIRVKKRQPKPQGLIVFPLWIPYLAFIVSAGFVLLELLRLL